MEGWFSTWEPLTPVGQGLSRTWTKSLPIPTSAEGDVLNMSVNANIYPTYTDGVGVDLHQNVPCTNEFTYTRPVSSPPPQPIFWYTNPECDGEEVEAYRWGAYINAYLDPYVPSCIAMRAPSFAMEARHSQVHARKVLFQVRLAVQLKGQGATNNCTWN